MKRKRGLSKTALSLCLAVLLVLQTLTFSLVAYAEGGPGEPGSPLTDGPTVTEDVYDEPFHFTIMSTGPSDKTAVLMGANTPFPLEVIQEGNVVPPGGAIHGRKPFTIKSADIRVPVKGDAPNPNEVDEATVILHGDEVNLDSAVYFPEVIFPEATLPVRDKSGFDIGTVQFSESGIQVVFDGEERFYNGQGQNVTFSFESTATADVTGMGYGTTKPINIFGAAYTLENPAPTPAYSITLKSNSNASENGWIYTDDSWKGSSSGKSTSPPWMHLTQPFRCRWTG